MDKKNTKLLIGIESIVHWRAIVQFVKIILIDL